MKSPLSVFSRRSSVGVRQLAFYFDSSTCSGCKACQAACKDKNHLPAGILWRRVYEVTGGGWTRHGAAWSSDVFAYNVSISCNHCLDPICVEVCPSRAMSKRPDGIVLVEAERCLGCRYCSWACPYGAPQYDLRSGRMTKCNLCADDVDQGLPPACVAGCPLRAMDFGELVDLQAKHGPGSHIYPLPDPHLTRPASVIKPHREAGRAAARTARVANREEVDRRAEPGEMPLVVFTLLAQLAVGAFWTLQLISAGAVPIPVWFVLCALMMIALAASLFHLGSWHNAWRACANLRSSWLSREILSSLLFAGALVLFTRTRWLGIASSTLRELTGWSAALAGLALVYSMTRAYRLRTIPVWDNMATTVSFFATSLLLGSLASAVLLILSLNPEQNQMTLGWISTVAVVSLGLHSPALFRPTKHTRLDSLLVLLRTVFAVAALVAAALFWIAGPAVLIAAFLFACALKVLGRYLFYKARSASRYGV